MSMKTGGGTWDAALPKWTIRLFAGAALVLVPWTVLLYYTLPPSHLDRRWNLAWAGFDWALVVSLAITAFLVWRRSGWVVLAATATATLLFVDAWFDTLTATAGWDYAGALMSAACVEVPLACLSLWIAFRAGRHFFGKRAT